MTEQFKTNLIIEILNPFSNSIKKFKFEAQVHFDEVKVEIARRLSLDLASFYFTYSTDDGDEIKLDNNFELEEAISYFSDDEIFKTSISDVNDGTNQNKTIILKLSLVLTNLPSLSERTTSSKSSNSEIGRRSDSYSSTNILRKGKAVDRRSSGGGGGQFGTRREEIGSHSFFPQIAPPANTQYPAWVLNSNLSERSYGPPGFSAPSTSVLLHQEQESTPTRETFTTNSNSSSNSSGNESTPATTPESTPSAILPNSAPPTYTSGRSSLENNSNPNAKRISIQNETNDSTSPSLISEFSDYTYITATSSSSAHLRDVNSRNQTRRHIRRPTFSEHVTSAPQESYNVPNFLASLSPPTGMKTKSRSTSKLSTTPSSIFSSLTDRVILKCCGCSQKMIELRYICDTCGPVLPSQDENDDEVAEFSDDGTEIIRGVQDFEDPLGVRRASQIALPLSPTTQGSSVSFNSAPVSPSLTLRPSLDPSGILPIIEEEEEEEEEEEDEEEELERGGYELCSNCVETIGVTHAIEMSKLEEKRIKKSYSNLSGEERISSMELRHAFSECMKVPSGSSNNLFEWRDVDYDDSPYCTICTKGPIVTNRFKCLSCKNFELCLNCFRTVEDIHPIHTFLTIPDLPARPNNFIIPTQFRDDSPLSTIESTRVSPEDFRKAFLRARGVDAPLRSTSLPRTISFNQVRHTGIVCFGCLNEIIGPRFTCSSCTNFDLCSKCELIDDPPLTSPDGRHEASHIILKIKIPVSSLDEIDSANARARIIALASTAQLEPQNNHDLRTNPSRPSAPIFSPPSESVHYYPPTSLYRNGYSHIPRLPPPPPNLGVNLPPSATVHEQALPGTYPLPATPPVDICDSCDENLVGIKWLCANCETRTFLCSTCENSSHITHDALHCFLKITGPLHPSLPTDTQLLPILYDLDSLNRSSNYLHDSNSVDHTELNSNVLCDFCLDNVNGWSRCVHCETSFDICSNRCLDRANHFEGVHVFVKFNRRVDIKFLKELTGISNGSAPKALIPYALLAN